jgi:hypothetical protein
MDRQHSANNRGIESEGIRQQLERGGHRCGNRGPDQSIRGSDPQECDNRDIRRAAASRGGRNPSAGSDAAATRSAGRVAVPDCGTAARVDADCSDPAAARAVADCSGRAAAVAACVVAGCSGLAVAVAARVDAAVPICLARADPVDAGHLVFRLVARAAHKQEPRFRDTKKEWRY